ncbi:MAG: retropepsin-like aspartic protease [Tsuneonella sp.]
MRTRLALAAAALIAAAPAGAGQPAAAPPLASTAPMLDAANTETVAAQIDRYRRLTVPVTIAGRGPFRFMIDTGAQATVVSRRLSTLLALKPLGHATVVGMASSERVDLVRLDGLEFAARVFDHLDAPLLEGENIGADGILGLDSLQDLRVLIDFRAPSIAVGDAAELGGNQGYEIVVRARNKLGRMIITNARVDGVATAVIIETGAQGTMANRALQRKLRSRREQDSPVTDVHGNRIVGQVDQVKALTIDKLQMNALLVTFADSPAFAALGYADKPALVLGMDDMRLFDRVAIDFASRKVLFDMPAGSGRPAAAMPWSL